MATYSLDDIRAAADAKYGHTDLDINGETVTLLNPLRLRKEKRDELLSTQKRLEIDEDTEADEDQLEVILDMLRIVAKTPRQAETLIEAIDGDLALAMTVFERYTSETEAGEA